ncbi:NUDIX domain-containing protein [Butyrivibrio sp. AE2032]|uniref:NUDIX domain-containing protein n=1 Tax=Butyrivibrio sp. AE2032 TaxID=1458463 RepID=UPI0005512C69|nr:NUDIX hydrolase [Butyrivibrio sp. AE2032]
MGKINCSDDMLFEKTVSSKTVFEGRIFDVEVKDITTPEGRAAKREIVKHPGGACILPVDDEGFCYLVKQFRSPFEKVMLEAPAGKLEKGEEPLACVTREITEETGFVAGNIESVGAIAATPGYCSEIISLFIGTGLVYQGGDPDQNEYIATVKLPLKEALEMAENGSIKDAKTLVLLYKAARRFGI